MIIASDAGHGDAAEVLARILGMLNGGELEGVAFIGITGAGEVAWGHWGPTAAAALGLAAGCRKLGEQLSAAVKFDAPVAIGESH